MENEKTTKKVIAPPIAPSDYEKKKNVLDHIWLYIFGVFCAIVYGMRKNGSQTGINIMEYIGPILVMFFWLVVIYFGVKYYLAKKNNK